jgi:hypothetical protein
METPNTGAEPQLSRWAAWPKGDCGGSIAPSTPMPRSSASARRASGMTRTTIEVDPYRDATRVEGEGGSVVVRDGNVLSAELNIFEPPRFFEAFLRGRHFTGGAGHHGADLRHLSRRLSDERGACSGSGARRRIVGGPLRLLRRLIYCGEWIESHALAHLHAACARLPRLRQRHRTWPRTMAKSCAAGSTSRRSATNS